METETFLSFLLAFSVASGFLSHLVLDELFSATNFNGKLFHPNAMLGTALKFWSHSTLSTTLAYVAILVLAYRTYTLV